MTERERAITNLMAVDLRGGSHEMLSSIAKAIHKPTCGGWTIGACQVVVSRCTPEVRSKSGILGHHFCSIYSIAAHVTGMFVELDGKVFTFYQKETHLVINDLRRYCGYVDRLFVLQFHVGGFVWIQCQLVFGYYMTGRKQTFGIL